MADFVEQILRAETALELGWVEDPGEGENRYVPRKPGNKRWRDTDTGAVKYQPSKPSGSSKPRGKKAASPAKEESKPAAGPSLTELWFEQLVKKHGQPKTAEELQGLKERAQEEMAIFEKGIPATGWGEKKALLRGPYAPSRGWKGERDLRDRLEELQKAGLLVVAHDAAWDQYVARAGTPLPDWLETEWEKRPKGYKPVPEGLDPFNPPPPKKGDHYTDPELKEIQRVVRTHPEQLHRERRCILLQSRADELSKTESPDFRKRWTAPNFQEWNHGVLQWMGYLADERWKRIYEDRGEPEKVREYLQHARNSAAEVDRALDFFDKHLEESDPQELIRLYQTEGKDNGYIRTAVGHMLTHRFRIPVEDNDRNWRVRDHGYVTTQALLDGKVTVEQALQHDRDWKEKERQKSQVSANDRRQHARKVQEVVDSLGDNPTWVRLANAIRKKYPGARVKSENKYGSHHYEIHIPGHGWKVSGTGKSVTGAMADLLKGIKEDMTWLEDRNLGFTLATPDPEPVSVPFQAIEEDVNEVLGALESDQTELARVIQTDLREAMKSPEPTIILSRVRAVLDRHHDRLVEMLAGARTAAGLLGLARLAQVLPVLLPEVDEIAAPLAPVVEQVQSNAQPLVRSAVQRLQSRDVLLPGEVQARLERARRQAGEGARRQVEATVQRLQDALTESVEEGSTVEAFRGKIAEVLEDQSFLAERHVETVFRSNVMEAHSQARLELVHRDPQISALYPYIAYYATHDDRVRESHKKLETLGLDGTNIYRADDPTFLRFMPPWEWNCRCLWRPVSVAQAARAGVQEAIRWQETGVAPTMPQHVTPPDFAPDPAYERQLGGDDPVGTILSMESVVELATEGDRVERDALEVMLAIQKGHPVSLHQRRAALAALSRLTLEQLARLREQAGLRLDPAKKEAVEQAAQEAVDRMNSEEVEMGWVDAGADASDPKGKRRVWKGTPPDKGTRKQISKPGSGRKVAQEQPTERPDKPRGEGMESNAQAGQQESQNKTPGLPKPEREIYDRAQDAFQELRQKTITIGGIVKIPELYDAVLRKIPGLTQQQFNDLLLQWQREGFVVLQICNDPRFEERKDEGIRGHKGLLFYIRWNKEASGPRSDPPKSAPSPVAAPSNGRSAQLLRGLLEGDVADLQEAAKGLSPQERKTLLKRLSAALGSRQSMTPKAPAKPKPQADPKQVDEAHAAYESLKQQIKTLTVPQIRSGLESALKAAPIGVIAGVLKKAGYPAYGTRKEMVERLIDNLTSLKLNHEMTQRIGQP